MAPTMTEDHDSTSALAEHHRQYLADRAIPIDLAEAAGLRTLAPGEVQDALGWDRSCVHYGLGVPYDDRGIARWRVRLDGRGQWRSPLNAGNRPYVPGGGALAWADLPADAIARSEIPLVITEAPTKALALLGAGYAAIGAAGASAGIHDPTSPRNARRAHPELRERVALRGRQVVLVPDGGVRRNEHVAHGTLIAGRALDAEGADVRVALLPLLDDDRDPGPDDVLARLGPDAIAGAIEHGIPLHDFERRYGRRSGANGDRVLELRAMADVDARRVEWIWPGRIPAGAVSLLDGDPGTGKSTLTVAFAARVSRGHGMPDGSPGSDPADVLIASAEDDPHRVLRPRLEAAGARLERVHVVRLRARSRASKDSTAMEDDVLALPEDTQRLEDAVKQCEARLVIIDPLVAHFDDGVDTHKDGSVRRALAPLARLAERTGAAILAVRHLAKADARAALYRGGGSIGIIGAARSALLVAPEPNGEDDARVIAQTKSNLAPLAPALAYRSIACEIESPDGPCETSRIEWLGEREITADELVAALDKSGQGRADAAPDYDGTLADLVAANSGRWSGSASQLLVALRERCPDERWPGSPEALSRALSQARLCRVRVARVRSRDARTIVITPSNGGSAAPLMRTAPPHGNEHGLA